MTQQVFTIEFEFVSAKAYGDSYKLAVEVRAPSASQAENIAWMQRGTFFGARGTDDAIDCRAVQV